MTRGIRQAVLALAHGAGLTRLAAVLSKGQLSILGYHGVSFSDEHVFSPGLFMSLDAFAGRVERLEKWDAQFLPLNEAVDRLAAGTLPRKATVLTFDDGWCGIGQLAWPILKAKGIPATLYLTTYYVDNQMPVFNVLLDYLFWKRAGQLVDLTPAWADAGVADLTDAKHKADIHHKVLMYGVEKSAPDRAVFAQQLCGCFGVSWEDIEKRRLFYLHTPDQLRQLAAEGLDIQLHGHRHFGSLTLDDPALLAQEIGENRRRVEAISGNPASHYCYPSGYFKDGQLPHLRELGVRSATLTRPGLNQQDTEPLQLARLMDRDDLSWPAFAAEASGLLPWLRGLRQRD